MEQIPRNTKEAAEAWGQDATLTPEGVEVARELGLDLDDPETPGKVMQHILNEIVHEDFRSPLD